MAGISKSLSAALTKDLPVLFVYIGWAKFYDGTEEIVGNHRGLKGHGKDNSEVSAFIRGKDGLYRCGAGRGNIISKRIHVVFVSREESTNIRRVVGVYAAADVVPEGTWCYVTARYAILLAPEHRPLLGFWPEGQGMRRWASRGDRIGAWYPELQKYFVRLKKQLPKILVQAKSKLDPDDQTYADINGVEGAARRRLALHRKREARLRRRKIQVAQQTGNGLVCEVPGCGFDFSKRYGNLGSGYAHVHHLRPLSDAGGKGRKTTLDDLAIVCANCHAMIHVGGQCRPLNSLNLK